MAFENRELEQWWRAVAGPDQAVKDAGEQLGKRYLACLVVRSVDGDVQVHVAHHPNVAEEALEVLALESLQRVDSFLHDGPNDEPYVWQLRSDGDYQVWLVVEDLPEF